MTAGIGLFVLTAHLVGDFILQPTSWREGKREDVAYLVAHGVQYTLGMALILPLLPIYDTVWSWWYVSLVFWGHIWIDGQLWVEPTEEWPSRPYVVDQVLHMVHLSIVILLTYYAIPM